jgi:D-serine deaminase-like pyridoxal phosphate-dependent protein
MRRSASPRGARAPTPSTRGAGPLFHTAVNVWARVISVPELGLAYLVVGKRDVPFDEQPSDVQLMRHAGVDGTVTTRPLVDYVLFVTNDQHSHMNVPADSSLRVGDAARLGISHPCTGFEEWSLVPVIDDAAAETPVAVVFVRTYLQIRDRARSK